jgi:hypothetical protein
VDLSKDRESKAGAENEQKDKEREMKVGSNGL